VEWIVNNKIEGKERVHGDSEIERKSIMWHGEREVKEKVR
jgi:hypothetical protein